MRTTLDPRHQARIVALQKLFEIQYKEQTSAKLATSEIAKIGEIEDYDAELTNKLVRGVLENLEELDIMIKKFAPERPLDQMPKVGVQILRLSIYEGFIGKITPPKVAVDEAIEVAKEFGGETAGKFINGVLGNLLKSE